MNTLASTIRAGAAWLCRCTPLFKGKGRLVLGLDRVVTDLSDPHSYIVQDAVHGFGRIEYDLRRFGEKFAYYYGGWEPDHVRTLRLLYRGGDFVDVGSSVGLYEVCLADLVRAAGARILSVEPVPINRAQQERNLSLSAARDVTDIFPVAVGDREGVISLGNGDGAAGNFFATDDGAHRATLTTLDLLLQDTPRPIGMIKMDIEGFEPPAIRGARKTIERHRPIVFAEFNRERMGIYGFSIDESWEFFMSLGYSAFDLHRGRLRALRSPGSIENLYFLPPGASAQNT